MQSTVVRSFKVASQLSLVELTLPAKPKEVTKARGAVNHVWLYDRSGSMHALLGDLCEDLIKQARSIPVGDTLTLGWFSGEGQHSLVLKGFKVTANVDYAIVEKIVRANSTTMGSTCFSESLNDLRVAMEDLKAFSENFSFAFFTDGYPTVSNHQLEVQRILSTLDAVKGRLGSSLLIGYGESYNKELLTQMTERVGGSLIHSRDLSEVQIALHSFIAGVNPTKKVKVQLPGDLQKGLLAVFSEHEGTVSTYAVENGTVEVGDNLASLWLVTPLTSEKQSKFDLNDDSLLRASYAGALVLVQRTKSAEAIDVLNWVGDPYLLEGVVNAFTNTEYGSVEGKLLEAVKEKPKRFLKGRKTDNVPSEGAFCLLDLLKLLMEDEAARFYPRHPDFQYKRIGKLRKPVEGYPHFEADMTGVPFSTLTWHKEKLNLSVMAMITGTVNLLPQDGVTAEKVGLPPVYPTKIFRNYALIKDGKVNLSQLPISCSEVTKVYLTNLELIKAVDESKGQQPNGHPGILTIDLAKLPTINRRRAKAARSAKILAASAIEELRLECIMKVLNANHREQKEKEKAMQGPVENFLEMNGIKNGTFSPPVGKITEGEQRDFELVRSFEVSVKGASSSLPKVEAVEAMISKGKVNTLVGKFMEQGINLLKATPVAQQEEQWKNMKKELERIRRASQEAKFALLLSKGWFEEFTSRENCQIAMKDIFHDVMVDTVVSITIGEEKVEID